MKHLGTLGFLILILFFYQEHNSIIHFVNVVIDSDGPPPWLPNIFLQPRGKSGADNWTCSGYQYVGCIPLRKWHTFQSLLPTLVCMISCSNLKSQMWCYWCCVNYCMHGWVHLLAQCHNLHSNNILGSFFWGGGELHFTLLDGNSIVIVKRIVQKILKFNWDDEGSR